MIFLGSFNNTYEYSNRKIYEKKEILWIILEDDKLDESND